ncbi:SnoaL-like domain [Dillenia turbinata]|uniref:SnoaL-like domain n=1 Tax=Dillenia turbinata TaxID=194707 RepID=A0AAN8V3G3_9MAGN
MKLEVVRKIAVHWHANQKGIYDQFVNGDMVLWYMHLHGNDEYSNHYSVDQARQPNTVLSLKLFIQNEQSLTILTQYLFSAASGGQGSSSLPKPCQVKSEDLEGMIGSNGIALDEQTPEQELQTAIEEENYALAAKLRDKLRLRQMDSKALERQSGYYASPLGKRRPGVSGISGYDLVMGSWEFVWADYEFTLEIEIKDVQVHVRGDLGCVTCVELIKTKGSSWGRQFATNVFKRIDALSITSFSLWTTNQVFPPPPILISILGRRVKVMTNSNRRTSLTSGATAP